MSAEHSDPASVLIQGAFWKRKWVITPPIDPEMRPKGTWTSEEDAKLIELVDRLGPRDWAAIASNMDSRSSKQCRERWINQLNPEISKKPWTEQEDAQLEHLHSIHGNSWAKIAKYLPGRSDNSVKNRWKSTRRHVARAASQVNKSFPDNHDMLTEQTQQPTASGSKNQSWQTPPSGAPPDLASSSVLAVKCPDPFGAPSCAPEASYNACETISHGDSSPKLDLHENLPTHEPQIDDRAICSLPCGSASMQSTVAQSCNLNPSGYKAAMPYPLLSTKKAAPQSAPGADADLFRDMQKLLAMEKYLDFVQLQLQQLDLQSREQANQQSHRPVSGQYDGSSPQSNLNVECLTSCPGTSVAQVNNNSDCTNYSVGNSDATNGDSSPTLESMWSSFRRLKAMHAIQLQKLQASLQVQTTQPRMEDRRDDSLKNGFQYLNSSLGNSQRHQPHASSVVNGANPIPGHTMHHVQAGCTREVNAAGGSQSLGANHPVSLLSTGTPCSAVSDREVMVQTDAQNNPDPNPLFEGKPGFFHSPGQQQCKYPPGSTQQYGYLSQQIATDDHYLAPSSNSAPSTYQCTGVSPSAVPIPAADSQNFLACSEKLGISQNTPNNIADVSLQQTSSAASACRELWVKAEETTQAQMQGDDSMHLSMTFSNADTSQTQANHPVNDDAEIIRSRSRINLNTPSAMQNFVESDSDMPRRTASKKQGNRAARSSNAKKHNVMDTDIGQDVTSSLHNNNSCASTRPQSRPGSESCETYGLPFESAMDVARGQRLDRAASSRPGSKRMNGRSTAQQRRTLNLEAESRMPQKRFRSSSKMARNLREVNNQQQDAPVEEAATTALLSAESSNLPMVQFCDNSNEQLQTDIGFFEQYKPQDLPVPEQTSLFYGENGGPEMAQSVNHVADCSPSAPVADYRPSDFDELFTRYP